jgi:hypothetical protein
MSILYANVKGNVVYIENYNNEKDLKCPECDNDLVYVKESTRARSHFRHKANSTCGGETILHRVAKRLLVEHQDKWKFFYMCSCDQEIDINIKGTYVEEKPHQGYQYDVGVMNKEEVVGAIEVFVTHAVDPPKAYAMRNLDWCEVKGQDVLNAFNDRSFIIECTQHKPQRCQKCDEMTKRAFFAEENKLRSSYEDEYYQSFLKIMIAFDNRKTCILQKSPLLEFGKHSGKYVDELMNPDDWNYLAWLSKDALLFPLKVIEHAKLLVKGRCHRCSGSVGQEKWKTLCGACYAFKKRRR